MGIYIYYITMEIDDLTMEIEDITMDIEDFMVIKGNHPQMAQLFRLVNYFNLPRYIYIYIICT